MHWLRLGAENSERVTFVTAELWSLQGDILAWGRHALIVSLATATGIWQWDGEVWWPLDIPFSEECLEPLPHPLGCSDLFWGCEDAEQSSDAGEERSSSTQRGRGH